MGPGGPRGGKPNEKSKNFGAAMARIFKELGKLLIPTAAAVLFACGGSLLMIIAPNIVSNLVDEISKGLFGEINFEAAEAIAITLGLMYIAGALANLFEGLLMAEVSNRFAQKLRKSISRKINLLPLGYFDKNQTGDTLSRVTNDVDTISQSLSQSLATLISEFVLFVGVAVMMFATNVQMAGVAVAASFVGFVFMGFIMSKSQKYFSMRQTELGKLNSHIEQIYSGLIVVKAYNGKNDSDKKFDKYNQSVYTANLKSRFLGSLMHPVMNFIGNLGYVAVCVTGAILVKGDNGVSMGTIVAFITFVRLFTSPLSNIAQAFTSLQSAAAASERVFEFLDSSEMPSEQGFIGNLSADEIKGEIEFKHVKFGYNPDKLVIKDFNAKALPGQKIAIVGPTGAGKTTLVNLLMKFYDINEGEILIDGHSTHELKRSELHSLFTMVLQDTWMFEGTLRENIVYNRKGISDKEVMKVCDEVGLTHFVKTLPDGLDTKLSETDSISSGQKQLITIARGMIEDSPFLILDEATSNVDTRTEELVQQAMDKLTHGRTSFVIAHRLSTIKNADLILVMKEGDIIESGNHDELMKKKGFYAELYNSQFAL